MSRNINLQLFLLFYLGLLLFDLSVQENRPLREIKNNIRAHPVAEQEVLVSPATFVNKTKIKKNISNSTELEQKNDCVNGNAKCHFYIKRMINFYKKVSQTIL